MSKIIPVSIKCRLGKALKPGFSEMKIGKYNFSPLPSESLDSFETEFLLNFEDKWKEGQQKSNSGKEGEIILSWLSMILRQKIKISSFRLNNVQIQTSKKEIISFKSPIDFPENISGLYIKFKSLPLDLLERYVRACECYQESLLISTNNPTISFFLFVVCIECLSNRESNFYQYLMKELSLKEQVSKEEIIKINDKFINDYGLKNNFIEFVLSNFDGWKEDFSEDEFRNLLSSIYKIRSVFTHKGKNLEKYIKLVDSTLQSKSVFTIIGDKELEFPGLNYFSKIIQSVLINFLEKQDASDIDNIPELALRDSLVDLVAKETIQKGNLVTKNQIKHRN